MSIIRCSVITTTIVSASAYAGDWPAFRGPGATGIGEGATPPTTWDVETGENIRWRTPIPGLSHSSPIVWGDRIYVTTAARPGEEAELSSLYGSPGYGAGESVPDEGEHAFRLYCVDKNDGSIVWQRDASVGEPRAKRHPKSSHANPTPVCDDERVIAFFGSEGLHCFAHDGTPLWSRDFGVLNSGAPGHDDKDGFQWGFASSPILYRDKVIVQCDVENQSFLTVLDATTGEDVWRTDREEDSTWSTPNVVPRADGGADIIVNGYKHIGGYDLETGEELWKLVGGGDVPVPTPVIADGLIYITNAHGRLRPIYAIRADARGEITTDALESPEMVWYHARQGIYMQTPLALGDLLYCCSDGGILTAYDAKTGERRYRERLGTGGSGFSGSAVAVDDVIYFSGEAGEIHVVRAGPEFESIAVNDMGETCMATPAVSDGCLYIRSRHHLVAIGAPK